MQKKHTNTKWNSFECTTEDSNTLIMTFSEDDPFDAGILENAQKGFMTLDQHEIINVILNGLVPIEILAYVLEVSNYCNMIVTIKEDEKGFAFLSHLKDTTNANIELKYEGEING